ncbi:MAG: hypothetical protein EOP39_12070 [Rubrivivax sp.]|nr:MAG: hypothetical protein EOP39_12070 [Rubrivivax sp.]
MNTTMRCTCSGQGILKPMTLAPQLPSRQCEACEGSLLALDAYRRWRDASPTQDAQSASTVIHGLLAVEDSAGARACPQCNRLMQRLRVSTDAPDFRVDRCSPCQVVWFDRGEWQALALNGLAGRLDEVLSDGWQRQLRQGESRARREAALIERHGQERLQELARIRAWLDEQPDGDELLSLLRAGW